MNEIIPRLIDSIPSITVLVVLIRLLLKRVDQLHKDIKEIKNNCDTRLKWCIDHFDSNKEEKE